MLHYIDGLPSWSAFIEASAQDDEVAEMYAGREDEGPAPSPRLLEWTPERAELVKIHEAIQSLAALVSAVAGGNAEQPKPSPRPETAMDRYAKRMADASYDGLLDLIEEAKQREG